MTHYLLLELNQIKQAILDSNPSFLLNPNSYISLLTVLLLIWYSWATQKMKNEMVEQKKLSLRPFFMLIHDKRNFALKIKNIGNGHALNVRTDFSGWFNENPEKKLIIESYNFESFEKGDIKILTNGDYKIIEPGKSPTGHNRVAFFMSGFLFSPFETEIPTDCSTKLKIYYQDLMKNNYQNEFQISNGKISLIY